MTNDPDAVGWRQLAACRAPDYGPDWWHAKSGTREQARAKEICRTCPVRDECLSYGMEHDEHGVWGGLTPAERGQLRRKLSRRS